MLNELLLLSGNDVPFIPARITIHQPTIKEIAYIGEEKFFKGLELLKISKDSLKVEDNSVLESLQNFDIFMMVLADQSPETQEHILYAQMILALLFPNYVFKVTNRGIIFAQEKEGKLEDVGQIDRDNFDEFRELLTSIFALKGKKGESEDYNPANALAKKIADKLKRGRAQAAEAKGQDLSKIAIYSKYISILAVGERKDMNELFQYTVYQLLDEFQRFGLKMKYDMHIKAQLAGATNLGEIEDWMKDLQSDS